MLLSPPLRRRRAFAALAVAGGHVLLAGLALQLGTWPNRGPTVPVQAPLQVWLLDHSPPAAPAPRPAAAAAAVRSRAPAPRRPRDAQAEAPALSLPTDAAAPTTAAAAVAAPPSSAPAPLVAPPAAPRPLNLALPRGASAPWRQRHPGLDDPRANTARATLESRIAAALGGSDQITEERLNDGRLRLRRGSACVVVQPNRAQTLDPWNGSVFPKLRGVEKC